MTFEELAIEFEAWFQDKCSNTRATYGNSLRKLRAEFGNMEISQLPIRGFQGTILDKRVLKRMLFLAREWGYLKEVPIIKIPKEKVRTRFLLEDEIRLLIKYVKDPDLNVMIRVAIGTGLRKQNLFDLEWGQFDFNNMSLRVIVKGDNELYIPFVQELKDILLKYRSSRLLIMKRVFPDKNYDRKLRQYCRDLKIRDVSFHTLRHTYGSWLAMGGVDIKTVAELMGHKSIDTTQRYIHISSAHKKEAVKNLPPAIYSCSESKPV